MVESSSGRGSGSPAASEESVEATEAKRTKCEVYSRIVGYLRPVAQWNAGKQAEFKTRKTYELKS